MATFKDGRVTANGLSFHYVEWGSPASTPLLCLHGITQTAHSWDEVAEDLSSDYRVICLDQRGHGDSDWAPNGEYNRRAMAADVDAITDAFGLSAFLLCGMSMGGINSITFTAQHPNKVRALVIVDVSPEIKSEGVQNIRTFIQASDDYQSCVLAAAKAKVDAAKAAKQPVDGSIAKKANEEVAANQKEKEKVGKAYNAAVAAFKAAHPS